MRLPEARRRKPQLWAGADLIFFWVKELGTVIGGERGRCALRAFQIWTVIEAVYRAISTFLPAVITGNTSKPVQWLAGQQARVTVAVADQNRKALAPSKRC